MSERLYVGLMSGTSLDGVDAVLADFSRHPVLIGTHYAPYPDPLRAELLDLQAAGANELERSADAAVALARLYADAVAALLASCGVTAAAVTAIGAHGQTVRHRPDRGWTLQLLDGATLAERSGIRVVCDLRSRDVAAGGQGAPLVPAYHAAALGHPDIARAVVNIGGIANVTRLPGHARATNPLVTGFDCGPGNVLMDGWCDAVRGERYDGAGAWAATGSPDAALLARMLAHPYFGAPPPKSTGRDTFHLGWVRSLLAGTEAPQDVQATLLELTAASIVDALDRYCPGTTEIYVCGGGARNDALMARMRVLAAGRTVDTTARLGMDPDWVEALAFAWLAREALAGRPGNLPAVTGARGPRILGCVHPA